jgi:hypothetical protein
MKRSVRNGIAIAGMAGGLWFLGQAVANAEVVNNVGQTGNSQGAGVDNDSDITNSVTSTTTNTALGGRSSTGNDVLVVNKNGDNDPVVVAGTGGGSDMHSESFKGPQSHPTPPPPSDVHASVAIDASVTNTISVKSGSNTDTSNAVIGAGAPSSGPVTITNDVKQSGTTTSNNERHDNRWDDKKGPATLGSFSQGGGRDGVDNDSDISNEVSTSTTNTADAGNSSTGNDVTVINKNGDNDPRLYCFAQHGDVYCSITIDASVTNNITVVSGDNCNTSNAVIGATWSSNCGSNGQSPAGQKPAGEKAAVAPAAAPHKAAPVHKAAALSNSQPAKTLAFTGAETSLPLTLGLLALGAGGALTLAGRRRETTTV